jgi:hypothetical protein
MSSVEGSFYLDLARIFLRFRFNLRMRFFLHLARIVACRASTNYTNRHITDKRQTLTQETTIKLKFSYYLLTAGSETNLTTEVARNIN